MMAARPVCCRYTVHFTFYMLGAQTSLMIDFFQQASSLLHLNAFSIFYPVL